MERMVGRVQAAECKRQSASGRVQAAECKTMLRSLRSLLLSEGGRAPFVRGRQGARQCSARFARSFCQRAAGCKTMLRAAGTITSRRLGAVGIPRATNLSIWTLCSRDDHRWFLAQVGFRTFSGSRLRFGAVSGSLDTHERHEGQQTSLSGHSWQRMDPIDTLAQLHAGDT